MQQLLVDAIDLLDPDYVRVPMNRRIRLSPVAYAPLPNVEQYTAALTLLSGPMDTTRFGHKSGNEEHFQALQNLLHPERVVEAAAQVGQRTQTHKVAKCEGGGREGGGKLEGVGCVGHAAELEGVVEAAVQVCRWVEGSMLQSCRMLKVSSDAAFARPLFGVGWVFFELLLLLLLCCAGASRQRQPEQRHSAHPQCWQHVSNQQQVWLPKQQPQHQPYRHS
jgi:hypothetical protein